MGQQFSPTLYEGMRWRMIGPFRGGRTVAATGIPGKPSIFYIAPNNGGVWKTTDFGRTWTPIFDDQPTGSIGALAVAPSNPDIIYVGSGEGLRRPDLSTGDGIYKSTDGGQTWKHLGLRDGLQIGAILVDPHEPNRVFVGVLGHPYGPNAERGVFRSLDGGLNWQKVLYKDENTGAIDLAFDPGNPQTIYADMWASRRPPWTTGGSYNGPGSGLYKSTDSGTTWRQLTRGLPTWSEGLGRIGIGIAPGDPHRIYALVDSPKLGGLYRSDDAGESWERINTEQRIWGRGDDFACVHVHPKNKNIVFVANTSTYRSTNAGKDFTAIKGARRVATIITPYGSIRRIPTLSSLALTRARLSASTVARLGVRGTTSQPRSSITSLPTINFHTGFTAGSRKAAALARPAAAISVRSVSVIGIR